MRDLMLYFLVIAVSGLIFFPLHIVAIRANRGAKLITMLNATTVLSAVISAGGVWWLLGDKFSSEDARLLACVSGCLSFLGYAGVYSLIGPISVDRSISQHIVTLAYLSPGRRIKTAELFQLYTQTRMLEKRFNDCTDTGILERHGDEILVTRRGARIALLFLSLGKLLGMKLWYLDGYRALKGADRV